MKREGNEQHVATFGGGGTGLGSPQATPTATPGFPTAARATAGCQFCGQWGWAGNRQGKKGRTPQDIESSQTALYHPPIQRAWVASWARVAKMGVAQQDASRSLTDVPTQPG